LTEEFRDTVVAARFRGPDPADAEVVPVMPRRHGSAAHSHLTAGGREAHAGNVNGTGTSRWWPHDNKKQEMLSGPTFNRLHQSRHEIFATGPTGTLLAFELGRAGTRSQAAPRGGSPGDKAERREDARG